MTGTADQTANAPPTLRARRLGLHSQHQAIAVMRTDCHVCRAEGLSSRSQVLLSAGGRQVLAMLYQADGDLVAPGSGGSISFSFPEGLYLEVLSQGVPEPDWPICLQLGLLASGAQLVAEGVPVEDPQELQRRLAEGCALFRSERLPLLQALGALPAGD